MWKKLKKLLNIPEARWPLSKLRIVEKTFGDGSVKYELQEWTGSIGGYEPVLFAPPSSDFNTILKQAEKIESEARAKTLSDFKIVAQ